MAPFDPTLCVFSNFAATAENLHSVVCLTRPGCGAARYVAKVQGTDSIGGIVDVAYYKLDYRNKSAAALRAWGLLKYVESVQNVKAVQC